VQSLKHALDDYRLSPTAPFKTNTKFTQDTHPSLVLTADGAFVHAVFAIG
jgi:hypothetical protein